MKDIIREFNIKGTDDKFYLKAIEQTETNQIDRYFYYRSDKDNIIVFADYDIPISSYEVNNPLYSVDNPTTYFIDYISNVDGDRNPFVERLNAANNLIIYVEHRIATETDYLIIKDDELYKSINKNKDSMIAQAVSTYAIESLKEFKED